MEKEGKKEYHSNIAPLDVSAMESTAFVSKRISSAKCESAEETSQNEASPISLVRRTGIPRAAASNPLTAPVHVDVGGVNYTTTLETLTR
jgi:hypothetical protein